ncbi:MAG: ABC transporter ATP-binding protein [Pseudomonadota bacterium]
MTEPILSARNVHVYFQLPGGGRLHAVRGIDLDLFRGETVAIVGESGAGKSAFAKAILHLHQLPFTPNRTKIEGSVSLNAPFSADLVRASDDVIRDARARAVGMIFQDALSALNPVHRIGDQIEEALRQVKPGIDREAAANQVYNIVRAIGLPDPERAIRAFPHQLSGGQCQRVMIAIAAVRFPVALIADEPTTALDVTVQAQILKLLKSIQDIRGMGMLFISHDLGVVAEIADRVAVMYAGEIVEIGTSAKVFSAPEHAYTRALLASRPGMGSRRRPTVPAAIGSTKETSGAVKSAPVLTTDKVSFGYRSRLFGRGSHRFVLQDLSLDIEPGEVHGLVGESGSGKSTFGRLALGFLKPDSGSIKTCGTTPYAVRGVHRRDLRRNVQVVYQDSATALNPRMSLGHSAAEGLVINGMALEDAREEVHRLFDRVRLPTALMNRYPHEVSGGQRQRVCIARAIATKPRLLIADEPVTALDVSVQAQILDLFGELQAELGLAMLLISHDLGVVRELSCKVSVMHNGRIVETGSTADVFGHPRTAYSQKLISSIPGQNSTLDKVAVRTTMAGKG